MARFTLCADDFAMTPAVTRGILALLERERLSATGTMTNRPHWREAARTLEAFRGKTDLGVHLNLTCGAPLTRMTRLAPGGELPKLPAILRAGVFGALPLDEIEAEVTAQVDAFEQAAGFAPDFIDGHQHVHALPGVRRALLAALKRLFPDAKPYLRDPADRFDAIRKRGRHSPKALLLAGLTRPFGGKMREAGFATNHGFSGYSAFDPNDVYAADFARYLIAPGEKHLVMCHPGEVDDELLRLDPATESRAVEQAFFLSGRFDEICAEAGMTMGRLISTPTV
jgi:predicted glycoside hydrolase/deacetylase ChbG (UPF0249 family)